MWWCVSGVNDSFTLLDILLKLHQRAATRFELTAINLDQYHPGFLAKQREDYLMSVGVACRMLKRDTYPVVKRFIPKENTIYGQCSHLRRGVQ